MAQHRHRRETNARQLLGARLPRPPRLSAAAVAGPLAVVATAGVVSLGVLGADVNPTSFVAAPVAGDPTTSSAGEVARQADPRRNSLSRDSSSRGDTPSAADEGTGPSARIAPAAPAAPTGPTAAEAKLETVLAPAAVAKAVANADTERWTTAPLNLWSEPGRKASQTGEIAAGELVVVTGRTLYGRQEIVWEETETRWVTAGYLSETEPFALGGECTNGTSVASGVSPNIVAVHQAVCAAFPDISVYGTFRSDGEHAQGIAVDIMVSGDEGYAVAEFVRENYAELGVNYLIYAQEIWSVDRASEGWRGMEDRGSTTANHYDHVHVTTY